MKTVFSTGLYKMFAEHVRLNKSSSSSLNFTLPFVTSESASWKNTRVVPFTISSLEKIIF